MSPSSGDAPQLPDRSSSASTLLEAFRSLTGGRMRTPTPPISTSPKAAAAQPPSTATKQRSQPFADPNSGSLDAVLQNGVPQSYENVGPSSSSMGNVNRGVVGGPPELEEFIAQLHRKNYLSERLKAISKICFVLEEHSVRNVLSIWSTASDLLGSGQPPHASDAAYKLLKSCAGLPELLPVERNVFFNAAAIRRYNKNFDLRLEVIRELTNGGRNIEALETSISTFMWNSLISCFEQRKDRSRQLGGRALQEEENMDQLFQYIIDTTRFNSKSFNEEYHEQLLKRAIDICQETTSKKDIENSVKLFDTMVTYSHVPKKSLKPCLEIFCMIYRQLPDLREQTWSALKNLFGSHVGQSAVTTLLNTLLTGTSHLKSRQSAVFRGVLHVLQLLLLEDGNAGLPKVPISLLLPALKASISQESKTHESVVVNMIASMVNDKHMKYLLLHEGDWTDLIYIIHTCAERKELREVEETAKTKAKEDAPRANSAVGTTITSTTSTSGDPDSDMVSNAESVPASSSLSEVDRKALDDDFSRILNKLYEMLDDMDFVQKTAVMELFMRLAPRLSDSAAEDMVKFYADDRYLHPSNDAWLESCRSLVAGVFKDDARPRSLRIICIQVLRDTYGTVDYLCPADASLQCATLILNNIREEKDVYVLNELVEFAVDVADRATDETFSEIVELLEVRLEATPDNPSQHSLSSLIGAKLSLQFNPQPTVSSACNVLTTAFVRLFTRSLTKSTHKVQILFKLILYVAGSDRCEMDSRLTALKLLFRLRADANHSILVSASPEAESIAAVLYRTAETAVNTEKAEEAVVDDLPRPDSQTSWRDNRNTSPHSSLTRHTSRHAPISGRISKPIPPLWMYPGPKGLPEEPTSIASRLVYSHPSPTELYASKDTAVLKIALWLELVISLLQKSPHWEIYSYILVHLGPQLSNQSLFSGAVPQVKMLRSVLCEQIRSSSFHEPPAHTLLKKADVAVCLFHTLTMLISYNVHYERSEEDELVRTFLHGIGYWDRTSKWCIHALTLCCHETPLSMSKSLISIIQKMSQIVTQPSMAIHILEFLTSLARMPELFRNFREEEFKIVFGVSFRYLQYVRDQRERAINPHSSQVGHRSLRHSGASRDLKASSEQNTTKSKSAADDLPQYVYALAFHVITFWFMALKMPERKTQIPWITKNLIYTDREGREVTEEQSQVIMDMMQLVAYTDRDETLPDEQFDKLHEGDIIKKTWIVGLSLVTIETAARSGVSRITTRRPCGTRYSELRPLLTLPPRHQVPITDGLESEAFYSSSYIGVLPDDIFQSMYSPLNFPSVLGSLPDPPVSLPEDDMTRRAIAFFDRNPTVDGHRIGVIYIGESQTNEREILLNDAGPADYTAFINDLGTAVRLKDAKFNTGGLDSHDDNDGLYAICWRDRCIEIVFHITTMMPSPPDSEDQVYGNKKRHIGNDFVNIIFNDSGLPYDFNTFPSAFNYVHIVITPESRASFLERRIGPDPDGRSRGYKVQVVSKPGFPDISPAAETKIINGKNLAAYCRLIAINASVFSQVWSQRDGGESVSSWRNRLREIKRLKEKHGIRDEHQLVLPSSPPPSGSGSQTLSSPQSRDALKRTSVATFISEATSRSSLTSGGNMDVAL